MERYNIKIPSCSRPESSGKHVSPFLQKKQKTSKVKVISRIRRAGQHLSPDASHVSQHDKDDAETAASLSAGSASDRKAARGIRPGGRASPRPGADRVAGRSGQRLIRLGASAGLAVHVDVCSAAQPHPARRLFLYRCWPGQLCTFSVIIIIIIIIRAHRTITHTSSPLPFSLFSLSLSLSALWVKT